MAEILVSIDEFKSVLSATLYEGLYKGGDQQHINKTCMETAKELISKRPIGFDILAPHDPVQAFKESTDKLFDKYHTKK